MKKTLLLIALVAGWALLSCNNTANNGSQTTTEQAGEFIPSGDLQKDAQAIADMSIQASQRMLNGEGNVLEDQAHADKMIQTANEYYTKQGRGEEFQEALNAATEVNVDSLGVLLGKGQR